MMRPRTRAILLWAAILLATAAWIALAHAKPPPGADPDSPMAAWYQSLAQPETGYPCCSVADCRPVQYRTVGDRYEAFIDRKSFGASAPDDWVRVPKAHVLRRHDNPTGEAVACWFIGEIRCFVEGSGT